MTEEINCLNCGYYNADRCERLGGCFHHSKWQPISNPKVQITEEEARKILEVATILRKRGDMEIWTDNLKHAGYIRKSELVELVGEAEWTFENYRDEDNCITIVEALEINNRALQALKKDHPEFGGKK